MERMSYEEPETEEKKSRKPIDGAFRQQRLPAWRPVLTPRTVLPAFFIVGLLFLPIGGLLYWSSGRVDEIMIDYSHCGDYDTPVYLAPSMYSYHYSGDFDLSTMEVPAYHSENTTIFQDPNFKNPNGLTFKRCVVDFSVPRTMKGPVYMYYRLTNFYQNHRLYIKNYDPNQLLGHVVSRNLLKTSCDPLAYNQEGKAIYPCGLVANSMFNDTASNLTSITTGNNYTFSTTNIAWPEDIQKYRPTEYALEQLAPPPNWALRYPGGQYTAEYPPPDLRTMERLMVWMHMAALPDFRKIWARNDNDDLPDGRWRVYIDMNFDTLQYEGTKWLVLSATSPLGGRNPYIGIAYLAIGGLCVLAGLCFSLALWIKPRKLGDESYLSWNKEGGGLPTNKRREKLEKAE